MNRRQRRAGAQVSGTAASPLFAEATELHRAGRLSEAEALYRQILARDPEHAPSIARLGRLAFESGQDEVALELLRSAIARDGRNPEFHNDAGRVLERLRRPEEALASYRRAASLSPSWAAPQSNLAFVLRNAGRSEEAVRCFRKAASLAPDIAASHHNLGMALEETGAGEEARACYLRALERDAGFAPAHLALGNLLENAGDIAGALARYRQAVDLAPDLAVAHLNLGNGLAAAGRLAEAESAFGRALALRADYPEVLHNLANLLQEQGRLEEARADYERAIEANHADALMHLATLHLYRAESSLEDQAAAAARWAEHVGAGVRPVAAPSVARSDSRPRIGFVSGDFRTHAAGILTLPAIEAPAAAGWPLHCYSNSSAEDALTARFRAATSFRVIDGMPDTAVADRIRADRIDILFDVSGFTARNRIMLFSRRAAPVQIAWAAYPGTTGLAAMDYLLADARQVPPAMDRFYREAVIRLPHSYVCFAAPEEAPALTALPASERGHITFGSFNALKKLTDPVIAAWARILAALPDAQLLVKAMALDCPQTQHRFAEGLAAAGIAGERLQLEGSSPRAAQLARMGSVDIALDSFPYSGGVTTLEALWMGLPVVSVPGDSLASRHSLGYLTAIGLPELATENFDRYVATACDLARDSARLAELRASMRDRMLASPLCDRDGFRIAMEAALTEVWRRHRAGEAPAALDVAGGEPR